MFTAPELKRGNLQCLKVVPNSVKVLPCLLKYFVVLFRELSSSLAYIWFVEKASRVYAEHKTRE